ncbi:MAG: TauD/TfdA family dioxygenase [Alphaproteobacteria bacterium]|jgi:taurine dioxygenase
MEIEPVTGVIGAEVHGADLEDLTDSQFADIEQAFTDHLVLFFRDQKPLSLDAHVAFGRRFGPLHTHPVAPGPEGHPEVMIIQADANSTYADGNNWHSDVSCDELPPLGSCLQLRVLPPVGGDTLFANMYAAYETLSPMMQDFLADKTAMHESEHVYRGRYAERGVDDTGKVYPSAEHPVVRTHPRSGKQALFVNPSFTTKINGLTTAESKTILGMLYQHQQRPEFQVRFRWSENAIAFWDNRCTQHFAIWDYWPHERMGHRVTVRGERPYHEGIAPVVSELRVSRRHD